jgi:hypothetical protein
MYPQAQLYFLFCFGVIFGQAEGRARIGSIRGLSAEHVMWTSERGGKSDLDTMIHNLR